MLIYNQRPHRCLPNLSPFEVHHSNNKLELFLKQHSSEKVVKEMKFNAGKTVRNNRKSNIFEKENYLLSTQLLKCQKS